MWSLNVKHHHQQRIEQNLHFGTLERVIGLKWIMTVRDNQSDFNVDVIIHRVDTSILLKEAYNVKRNQIYHI